MSIAISSLKGDISLMIHSGTQEMFDPETYDVSRCTSIVEKALIAEKFFLGNEVSMLDNTFIKYLDQDGDCFTGWMNEFIRLPYPAIWIEVTKLNEMPQVERVGYYLERVVGHDVLLASPFFRFHLDQDGRLTRAHNSVGKIWFPTGVIQIINLKRDFVMHDFNDMKSVFSYDKSTDKGIKRMAGLLGQHPTNIFDVPLIKPSLSVINELDSYRRLMGASLSMIEMSLLMLSAKNIFYDKVVISSKTRKQRRKKNKKRLYSYHTLVARLENVQHRSKKGKMSTRNVALHRVKGVFAVYTREKPLFGHLGPNNIGPIWKPEHVRGHISNGNVGKDYCIKDAR